MYNGVYTIDNYAYMHDTLIKWLKLQVADKSLGSNILDRGITSVAVYGANDFGQLVQKDLRKSVYVRCFIDRYVEKFPDTIDGVFVRGIEYVKQLPSDCYIIVTPELYFREIMDDLCEQGVDINRILSLSMVV